MHLFVNFFCKINIDWPRIPHHNLLMIARASIIYESEVSITVLCLLGSPRYIAVQIVHCPSLSAMFNLLYSSTNQEVFKKHLCIKSSHYEKHRQFLAMQRKPSRATTKSTLFTVSKDEWNTKENTGKSLKNDMHVLQYTKRHTRNGCDGKLIAKILIATIQVNFVLNPSEMWRRLHKFSRIVVIRIFIINFPSQPFLGCHLRFHIFFHKGLLGGHTLFYSWAVFWIICLSALEVHDAIHMLQ